MSIAASILALGPLAYYKLDESAAGAVADSSGNGYHGATIGSALTFGKASIWSSWSSEKSIGFPGNGNGYIKLATAMPSLGAQYTIVCSFRTGATVALQHQAICGRAIHSSSGDPDYYLKIADTSSVGLDVLLSSSQKNASAASVTAMTGVTSPKIALLANTSYHLVVVRDGKNAMIQLNGSQVVYTNVLPYSDAVVSQITNPTVLGAGYYSNSVTDYFAQDLSHVAFFDRALSASDATRLYSVALSNSGHTRVSGFVRLSTNAGVSRLVRVFQRDNGRLLGETTSASDGAYSCELYSGYSGLVTVVAYDDGAAPDYEAVVADRVVPVSA